jgi:glycosyltransferase involved in cell wall biosynthesis
MNILHVIPYLGKAQGGPVESLRLLASAQAEIGHKVRVVHTGISSDGDVARFSQNVEVIQVGSFGPIRWASKLNDAVRYKNFMPDVVHSHVLWLDVGRKVARLSNNLGVPHIVSPCGMLHDKALRRSAWKKKVCRVLFQDKVLASAACLHAKSEEEYEGMQNQGLSNPVAVIPNPVSAPPILTDVDSQGFLKRHGIPYVKRIVLYVGRLHPIKGLERLFSAWSSLNQFREDWELVIAGPDENDYMATLVSQVKSLGCQENVTFTGALSEREKWEALKAANLFVMPSDLESFGSAIGEAMLAGLPVVTTTGTPWRVLRTKRCGWWVEPKPQELARALEEGISLSEGERSRMGADAQRLVSHLSPERIAKKMISVYEWLLGFAEQPRDVRMNWS